MGGVTHSGISEGKGGVKTWKLSVVGYGYFLEFPNNNKCKELRISFAKQEAEFDPIVVNGKALECV